MTISGPTFLDDTFRGTSSNGVGFVELAVLSVNDGGSILLSCMEWKSVGIRRICFLSLYESPLDLRSVSNVSNRRIRGSGMKR